MKKTLLIAIAMFGLLAHADFSSVFDGGWRISAGGVYDRGVKAKARFAPSTSYTSPFVSGGRTKAEAKSAAEGRKSGSRTDFGDGTWIDTDDPVYSGGDDYGRTRYYRFPGSTWNGVSSFTLNESEYDHVTTSSGGQQSFYASDESGAWGFNIELSRNIYHDEEYGWGVDAAIAFQYFRHNGLFKANAAWMNGSSTRARGSYKSVIELSADDYDDWNWHGEGDGRYYGSGDYSGNAGPIDGASVDLENFETVETDASYGSLDAEGDYDDLEMMLIARPYYDIFDWLRVNAMLGLVVSRQSMEMSFTMLRDGALDYRSSHDFSQWDVYGVAGLGLMLYWNDFTLGADFMARFLDRDMDISDRYYKGSVSRGNWMLRLNAGYEF